MPNIDRERGNYNIKEKVLGDIIADALTLGDEIKNRFRHFKNTSYHPHDCKNYFLKLINIFL